MSETKWQHQLCDLENKYDVIPLRDSSQENEIIGWRNSFLERMKSLPVLLKMLSMMVRNEISTYITYIIYHIICGS